MNNRFDQKAKELDSHPVINDVASTFARTLKEHIPLSKGMHVMDYGCGSGLIGMHLYKDIGTLTMVDSSEGMLNLLEGKISQHGISNMHVMKSTIQEASLKAASFDIIYMNNVLHHISDITSFFNMLHPLLKSGGYLCIGDLKKEPGTFHTDNTDVAHFGFLETDLSATLLSCDFINPEWADFYIVKKPDSSGRLIDYPLFFMKATKA